MSDSESFQAHACFTTTATAAAPTINRQERCAVTRTSPGHNAAAGLFYITTTEDIGGANGESVDYDVNATYNPGGTPTGVLCNVQKVAAFVWQVQVFTIVDAPPAAFALADLVGAIISVTLKRVDPA